VTCSGQISSHNIFWGIEMIPENVKMEIIIYFQIENVKLKVEILPLIVKFNTVWYCLHLTWPLEIRMSSTFQYNPHYFLCTFPSCFMFHYPSALVLFWCCLLHAVIHTAGSPDQDEWWRSSAQLCQWVSSLYFSCLCLQAVSTRPRPCLPSPHTPKQQKGRSSGSCLINNSVKNN